MVTHPTARLTGGAVRPHHAREKAKRVAVGIDCRGLHEQLDHDQVFGRLRFFADGSFVPRFLVSRLRRPLLR